MIGIVLNHHFLLRPIVEGKAGEVVGKLGILAKLALDRAIGRTTGYKQGKAEQVYGESHTPKYAFLRV
ncbi:hypothetical protein GCM10027347_00640 [Larkinella harenae]